MSDFLVTRGRTLGQRVIDALGTISCAPMAHKPSIADEIRERRTGTVSVGAISLKIGTVIDGAENCVYDVFAAPDEAFVLIFPSDTDIAFIEDIEQRQDSGHVFAALKKIWSNPFGPAAVLIHNRGAAHRSRSTCRS